jgi:hypothetical protein
VDVDQAVVAVADHNDQTYLLTDIRVTVTTSTQLLAAMAVTATVRDSLRVTAYICSNFACDIQLTLSLVTIGGLHDRIYDEMRQNFI